VVPALAGVVAARISPAVEIRISAEFLRMSVQFLPEIPKATDP
jgi:hypothetical protein